MTVKDIAKLGKLLGQFLSRFADCFARPAGRALLEVYVRGLLSDVQRKNAEAIALEQNVAPRTLQRFLESLVWNEQQLRDRCQQIVATEHAHRRPLDVLTKPEQPRAVVKQRESSGSTMAIGARSKTASTMSRWATRHGIPLSAGCSAVPPCDWVEDAARRKKTTSRTTSFSNQTSDCAGSDRPCEGQRHPSDGMDGGRTLWSRWSVPRRT